MTTHLIRQLIDKSILEDPGMNRGFEFRMSMAGDCQRKMDYDAQIGKPRPSITSAMRMLTGEPFHVFWRELLGKIYPGDFMFAEDELILTFEVDGENLSVPGHPDGYIKSLNAVVEVKSSSDSTFKMIEKNQVPLGAHYEQANIYAETLGAEWILFIYHNRNDGQYTLFLAPYSDRLAQSTVAKWAQVWRNRKLKAISARPYFDATGTPCFFCDHRERCYEGFGLEVKAFKTQETLDPALTAFAERYLHSRSTKLAHTKLEDQVKDQIAKWMFENKLNQIRVPELCDLNLKVGKNDNALVSIKPLNEEVTE